jgi:hypothetical protein
MMKKTDDPMPQGEINDVPSVFCKKNAPNGAIGKKNWKLAAFGK